MNASDLAIAPHAIATEVWTIPLDWKPLVAVGTLLLIVVDLVVLRRLDKSSPPDDPVPMWQEDPDVIKLMFSEADSARSMTASTVDELRTRTAATLTIVATTTAIFVAVSTAVDSPPIARNPSELAALSLFFVSAVCSALVLMPIPSWSFWPDISRIDFYANDGCDLDGIRMEIVNDIASGLVSDGKLIKSLQWLFIGAVTTFIAEVILWIVGILH